MRTGRPPEHGMSHTPEHRAWQHMMDRCYKEKVERYPNYGGRGIVVCERWHDFQNFYADMGSSDEGLTLDRIDVNGDYDRSNCRWADRLTQANNTTQNVFVSWGERRMTIAEWSRELGMGYQCLYRRIVLMGDTFPRAARPRYAR